MDGRLSSWRRRLPAPLGNADGTRDCRIPRLTRSIHETHGETPEVPSDVAIPE